MRKKHSVELIREGRFLAEVPVELLEDETDWSPYFAPEEIEKLDKVRIALQAEDLATASRYAKVFELVPLAKY